MKQFGLDFILIGLLIATSACQANVSTQIPTTLTVIGTPTWAVSATLTDVPTLDNTATAEAGSAAATAFVTETIFADLELAGYTPDQGELIWIQSDDLALVNQVAGSLTTQSLGSEVVAAHFVFGTDIEWDSDYSFTSCGVIFRTEDVTNGEQAQFNIFRLYDYPGWDIEVWNYGEYQTTFGEIFGNVQISSDILGGKVSTNHFVLIAHGSSITVFSNGKLLGGTSLKIHLNGRQFGLLAGTLQGLAYEENPGTISCRFTNTWIWELP